MIRHCLSTFATLPLALVMIGGQSPTAPPQEQPSPAALIAAQREAMVRLAFMDGVWRGPAWTIMPSGEKHNITQTERIGPFLDGSVKVMEGRGYDADGKVTFNAFATISFDSAKKGLHPPLPCDGPRRRFRADPHTRWLHVGHPRRGDDDPLHRRRQGWHVARLATASCPARNLSAFLR